MSVVMTDSKLSSVFPRRHFLDLVDDAWIGDALSDDEMDIASGADLDPSSTELEAVAWPDENVDRWNDLGLENWMREQSPPS
ncbi:hypothetical protein P43SY_010325 [Pythium insidiosum]|uniref:Anaphase-promoting complex subunit 13 n=1 Tax=Pythium insidiosum TaxID=114742 RepID=A0AAD5L9S2_PYTIN|nr:hypothetical protein P43SY_010325 [Pythium insidiosum]